MKSGHLFWDSPRIAFINGTSVGGMDLSEVFWKAHRQDPENGDLDYLRMHSPGAVTDAMAAFCRSLLPEFSLVTTISTACSAAGNAIMYGARLIEAGLADIVIAGGTDALCGFTSNGFNSLRILDTEICRPFDASRAGLNLGEGAGYLVLSAVSDGAMCRLTGWGNANEAYHQTASTPEGTGPGLSMSSAIEKAGLTPEEVPVRGGTDGATLSWKGLPCPNLGTGGFNFHGVCECTTVERLDKATEILLNIVEIYSK